MRQRSLIIGLIVLVFPFPPASADASARWMSDLGAPSVERMRALERVSEDETARARMLEAVASGPSEFARARREWMTAPRDLGGLGAIELIGSGAPRPGTSAYDDYQQLSVVGFDADLDGDGGQEVISYQATPSGRRLIARSGRTGGELWRRTLDFNLPAEEALHIGIWSVVSDSFLIVFSQIDDDPATDVIVVRERYSGAATPLGVASRDSATIEDHVEILDESDGSTALTWKTTGALEHTRAANGTLEIVNFEGLLWSLLPLANVGGTDASDIAFGVASYDQVRAAGQEQTGSTLTVDVLDQDSGDLLSRSRFQGPKSPSELLVASDVTGDSVQEIVLGTPLQSSWKLEAFGVVEPSRAWSTELDGAPVWAEPADLTSDPIDEIIVMARGPAGLSILEGRDAGWLWRDPSALEFEVVPDVDGDGFDDIFATLDSEPGVRVTSAMLGGRTGSMVWDVTTSIEGDAVVRAWPIGDVDRDGAHDVYSVRGTPRAECFDAGGGWFCRFPLRDLRVGILDGRTGRQVWQRSGATWGDVPMPIGGDADGDGDEDVATITAHGEALGIVALDGETIAPLWSVSFADAAMPAYASVSGFDLDGASGDELLVALDVKLPNGSEQGGAAAFSPSGLMWSVDATR